jgi:hypothetical protein
MQFWIIAMLITIMITAWPGAVLSFLPSVLLRNNIELPYCITAGKRFMRNEIFYKEPEADKTISFRVL